MLRRMTMKRMRMTRRDEMTMRRRRKKKPVRRW
jgi:hypothetical protein